MKTTNAPFDKAMVIRTIILIVALVNQFLFNAGYSPLPFDDEGIELAVTTTLTIVAAVWAWWKNNNLRYRARRNEQYLKDRGLK